MKKHYGLFAIFCLIEVTAGMGGVFWAYKISTRRLSDRVKECNKLRALYSVLNEWLKLKTTGDNDHSIEKYLLDNDYKSIAIYGLGELGKRLYEELEDSTIEIKYIIDQNASKMDPQFKVIDLNGFSGDVDAVIVTPLISFKSIEDNLKQMTVAPILSLEKIIYEI